MNARVAAVVLTLVISAVAPAADEEMGVPSDGLDIVKLVDGRILRCQVGPEVDGEVELNFSATSILIPKERIARIRRFLDFDSTAFTPAEQKFTAKGWVKWNGRWMDPAKAQKARDREEAPARKRREEDAAHSLWENRWKIDTKHFHIEANVGREALDFFANLMEDYYSSFTKKFGIKLTQREKKKRLPVFIFREREDYWTFFEKDTGGRSEHTRGYFVPVKGSERLVLFDQLGGRKETIKVLFHEATHFLLHLAEPQVVLPRWVHEGLAEYYGTAIQKGKKFVTGGIQDGRLLNFQDMIERNQVVTMDDLMSSGNSYAREGVEPRPFGGEKYAQAWVFAHYLLNGKKGRYARGFVDYLNKAITGRGGVKYTPISATDRKFLDLEDDKDLVRRCLRVKNLDRVLEEAKNYAKTLPLEGAWAYVERGLYLYWAERNPQGADQAFQKAIEVGGGDPTVLVDLAQAMLQLNRQTEARRHLDQALRLDPLNVDARLFMAKLLSGKPAIQELRVCCDIDPQNASALGTLAWMIYRDQIKDPYRATTESDLAAAKEALEFCQRAVALDPNHDRLDTMSALYLHLGEFEKSLEASTKAVQLEPEHRAYLDRLATANALLGNRKGYLKATRRIQQVLMRPRQDGGAPPPTKVVNAALDAVITGVVYTCVAWKKMKEAVLAADTWWQRTEPATAPAWYAYSRVHDMAGDGAKALQIAERGLAAFSSDNDLIELVRQLKREVK